MATGKWGIHMPNIPNRRDLDALYESGFQNFTLLHLNLNYVYEIRRRQPGARILVRAQLGGEYLMGQLKEVFETRRIVGDVRGLGLFIGIELVKDKDTKQSLHGEANMGWLSDQLLSRGLICRADDRLDPIIQLSPPLIITKEEMDRVVSVLVEVIGELEKRVR